MQKPIDIDAASNCRLGAKGGVKHEKTRIHFAFWPGGSGPAGRLRREDPYAGPHHRAIFGKPLRGADGEVLFPHHGAVPAESSGRKEKMDPAHRGLSRSDPGAGNGRDRLRGGPAGPALRSVPGGAPGISRGDLGRLEDLRRGGDLLPGAGLRGREPVFRFRRGSPGGLRGVPGGFRPGDGPVRGGLRRGGARDGAGAAHEGESHVWGRGRLCGGRRHQLRCLQF